MRLLATSTAEKRNTVRILFYGQSITEQKWGLNLDGVKFTRVPGVNEPIITTNVESLLQNP